ncbi:MULTISPECIES: SH3 domain-containing protein [unclassified Phormidesmis]
MSWSGLVKVSVGLLLAIALLAGGSLMAAQYFITKLSAPPPKPIYPNDKPLASKPVAKSKAVEKPEVQDDTPSAKPLPAGAFAGRVSQPIGLILRDAPGRDSSQIGGIDFNDKVFVLETSTDGDWQKVRLQTGDREGWVKAGNVEKSAQ